MYFILWFYKSKQRNSSQWLLWDVDCNMIIDHKILRNLQNCSTIQRWLWATQRKVELDEPTWFTEELVLIMQNCYLERNRKDFRYSKSLKKVLSRNNFSRGRMAQNLNFTDRFYSKNISRQLFQPNKFNMLFDLPFSFLVLEFVGWRVCFPDQMLLKWC